MDTGDASCDPLTALITPLGWRRPCGRGGVGALGRGRRRGRRAGHRASWPMRVREHVALCAVSTALAVAAAVPAGIAATRPALRRLARPLLFVANVGQSVPTIAVLALAFSVTGIGFRTAVIGLWAYSLLPVLRNTVAGLAGVDPAMVEAARGMGMSPAQVLRRVELPLAWPVIVAGIRTAAVVNVGTAALATFVGAGGLGDLITVGLDNQRDRILYTGAALTALLALAVDWAIGHPRRVPETGPGGRLQVWRRLPSPTRRRRNVDPQSGRARAGPQRDGGGPGHGQRGRRGTRAQDATGREDVRQAAEEYVTERGRRRHRELQGPGARGLTRETIRPRSGPPGPGARRRSARP